MPLVDELRRGFGWSLETIQQTTEEAVAFIRAVVYSTLIKVRPPPDHLKMLIDATRDGELFQIPIYTLNHDCLLEDIFEAQGIELFDFRRYDRRSGRVRLDMEMPIPRGARAVLMKPHGSVRWRRFAPLRENDIDPWHREWIGWDTDQNGKRHDDGNRWRSCGGAEILVGRFNKELDYLNDPYWQIFFALSESLRHLRQIVVSGYSFGDKAINGLLINWVYARPRGERQIVVMHRNERALLDGARDAIRKKWEIWSETGMLRFIPHFPCAYSWAALRNELMEA
jgi:hypothetical protein